MLWKVLLVEDEVFVRKSIREIIKWEDMGVTVIGESGDGVEAVEFIEQHKPDLVITDIIMPKMSGVELFKKTREAGNNCHFVMLTCMGEFEYVRQAMEYGASNYILKLSMSVQALRDTLSKISNGLSQRSLPEYSYEMDMEKLLQKSWDQIIHPDKDEVEVDRGLTLLAPLKSYHLMVFCILHGLSSFTMHEFHKLQILGDTGETRIHLFTELGQTTVLVWSKQVISLRGEWHKTSPYSIVYTPTFACDEWLTASSFS